MEPGKQDRPGLPAQILRAGSPCMMPCWHCPEDRAAGIHPDTGRFSHRQRVRIRPGARDRGYATVIRCVLLFLASLVLALRAAFARQGPRPFGLVLRSSVRRRVCPSGPPAAALRGPLGPSAVLIPRAGVVVRSAAPGRGPGLWPGPAPRLAASGFGPPPAPLCSGVGGPPGGVLRPRSFRCGGPGVPVFGACWALGASLARFCAPGPPPLRSLRPALLRPAGARPAPGLWARHLPGLISAPPLPRGGLLTVRKL